MAILLQIILYFLLITLAIFLVRSYNTKKLKAEQIAWYQSRKNTVLSILVPKENEKKPVAAEQFFASLHGIFRAENKFQDLVSFEIVSRDKFIQFYAIYSYFYT